MLAEHGLIVSVTRSLQLWQIKCDDDGSLTLCFFISLGLTLGLWLALWLSGNALASINVVALRQTRSVPGWVTVCGRVNHLGM